MEEGRRGHRGVLGLGVGDLPMMAIPLFADVALTVSWALAGYGWARSLHPRGSWLQACALAFPLGAGGYTILLFLLSIAGVRIAPPIIGWLLVVWCVLPWIVGRGLLRRRKGSIAAGAHNSSAPEAALLVAGVTLALTAVVLSLGRSYSTWDAIAIWSVKGYGIAKEGSVFAAKEWGAHGLSYPLNLPLQISVFRLWDGDLLPGSKLIFPAYYVSMALGALAFWRRDGKYGIGPALGALFLASIPLVFEHGSDGYANLPLATHFLLGTLLSVEGIRERESSSMTLSGILFGLAAWTRPEGMFMAVGFLAVLGLFLRASRASKGTYFALALPFFTIAAGWLVFNRAFNVEGLVSTALQGAGDSLKEGDLHLQAISSIAWYSLRDLASFKDWGLAFPLVITSVLFRIRSLGSVRNRGAHILLIEAVVAGLGVVGSYYFLSFTGDLPTWLGTGVNRMYLPAGVLAVVGGICLLLETPDGGSGPDKDGSLVA